MCQLCLFGVVSFISQVRIGMRVYPEGSKKKASLKLLAKVSFLSINFSGFAETLQHGGGKGREREKQHPGGIKGKSVESLPPTTHTHTHTDL